jgi:hypothetical protein
MKADPKAETCGELQQQIAELQAQAEQLRQRK